MSYCKKCHKHISADCFLDIGICVFCYYKTNEWESNGAIATRKEAIKDGEKVFRYFQSTRLKSNRVKKSPKKKLDFHYSKKELKDIKNLVKKEKSKAKIFKSGEEFSRYIKKLTK